MHSVTLTTILGFLSFRSTAIRKLAVSRMAFWVGLGFVFSAGLAREYDGEYLLAEPWHLLLPLAASLIGCLGLTLLVWLMSVGSKQMHLGFWPTFLALLNLYWLTAPMAWLYAVPVERFLTPGQATRANLGLLAVVSVWRVALMSRAISVLYQVRFMKALVPVMLFSIAMVSMALQWIPSPVFMIMGGVRLTESETIILGTRFLLIACCVVSAPILLIAYVYLSIWQPIQAAFQPDARLDRISAGLWTAVAASWLVWLLVLPATQAEQGLRDQAENSIRNGAYADLCQLAQAHPASDFPPHWDPPPRIGYGEQEPELIQLTLAILEQGAPPWLQQMYLEKLSGHVGQLAAWYTPNSLSSLSEDQLELLLALIPLTEQIQWRELQAAIEREIESTTVSATRREILLQLESQIPR